MWFVIGLVSGFVLGALTWPKIREHLIMLRADPLVTLRADRVKLVELERKAMVKLGLRKDDLDGPSGPSGPTGKAA